MNDRSTPSRVDEPGGARLFRIAGLSAIAIAAGYAVAIPIYALVGDQPATGIAAQLAYFGQHATGWWGIAALMVGTDLLYIPVYLGMYVALQHVDRGLAAIGAVLSAVVFVVLDLAVTWTGYATMIGAGSDFVASASASDQAALVAAAAYPAAVLQSPILGTYAIVVPALGALCIGLAMRNGPFGRPTASLAIAMGGVGVLFLGSYVIEALSALRYVTGILAIPFYLLAGVRLYRLGRA